MKPPALWIPSAEIERAGRVVPFGGGKAARGEGEGGKCRLAVDAGEEAEDGAVEE